MAGFLDHLLHHCSHATHATATLEIAPADKPVSTALLDRIHRHFVRGGRRGTVQTKWIVKRVEVRLVLAA